VGGTPARARPRSESPLAGLSGRRTTWETLLGRSVRGERGPTNLRVSFPSTIRSGSLSNHTSVDFVRSNSRFGTKDPSAAPDCQTTCAEQHRAAGEAEAECRVEPLKACLGRRGDNGAHGQGRSSSAGDWTDHIAILVAGGRPRARRPVRAGPRRRSDYGARSRGSASGSDSRGNLVAVLVAGTGAQACGDSASRGGEAVAGARGRSESQDREQGSAAHDELRDPNRHRFSFRRVSSHQRLPASGAWVNRRLRAVNSRLPGRGNRR